MILPGDFKIPDWQMKIINKMSHITNNGGRLILRPRCPGRRMTHHYFLNEDHTYRPCELMEWAKQFETIDRHVGEDDVDNHRISTVWLGLDHNYWGGPPLVFETMVFKPNGEENYCVRYTTWDEAVGGHQKAVQWVKDGCKEDEE
jgi:hypothetical protein